ncbi:MAG: endonuclease, partial [Rhodothermales bacterium]
MKDLAACALLVFIVNASFGQATDPLINEFVANHTGADVNEFIEVFGDPDTDYSTFTVLEIEGDSGGSLGVIDGVFPVGTTNADGFSTTGFRRNALENGTITLLLVENFTGSKRNDLDTDDDGAIDPAPPWARLVDHVAVTDGGSGDLSYSDVVLARGFDGNSKTPGGASRLPNGVDTDTPDDWLRNDPNGDGLP